MKKKFMRGIAAFLAAVMMLPTAAFANTTPENPDPNAGIAVIATPTVKIDKELYDGESSEKTAQLSLNGVPEGATITWVTFDTNVIEVNASTGAVTAKSNGTATVSARYTYTVGEGDAAQTVTETVDGTVIVKEYKMTGISIDPSKTKTDYVAGQKISASDIYVNASYSDGSTKQITSFTYTPDASTVLTAEHKKIDVSAGGHPDSVNISVTDINVDELVDSVSLSYPKSTTEFKVGDKLKLSDVEIAVTYLGGSSSIVTPAQNDKIKVSGITFSNGSYTFSSDDVKSAPTLKVKYADQPELSVTLKVVEKTPEKTITGIDARPSKTEYSKGATITKSTDVKVYVKYSDGSESELASNQYTISPATLSTAGTVTVTVTAKSNTTQYTDTYTVTVKDVVNVTGIKTSSSYYELEDDIDIKVGDKLNDDVMWYDVFKEVYIIVDGERKLIDSKSDLENYSGVELLLRVYNKSSKSDTIEAKDINSDGEVRLQLYLKVGSTSITSTDTDKSLRVYVKVKAAECTVSIYKSKTSTSSSYLMATKTFSDFSDALEALKDEDEIDDVFDVSLGTNYAIRIKFGEDQELSKNYEFEPDYENPIFIDLNGYELKLPSDWIVYDDCEDLVVTVTNSNDDDDGKLTYRDKSVSLVVTEDSELEFSDGNIPMDSDAAVTVSIYRNANYTSSTYLIKTKVYDDLEEALVALRDHEDAVETFDIPSSYEDTFVARIKLGEDEDQDLDDYEFAPDYDTTIYIDLNGNKLELESEWIDYEDCEDLVVKINNTHEDDKATLTYTDKNLSLTIAKGDSALEFEEDVIPGIYKISLGTMTNGKATMSKDTIAHGGTVKFTITPNSGYAIDTVKVNSKTVKTSDYSVDSKGVGTLELKEITEDKKLDVTFKKASTTTTTEKEDTSTTTDWINPFTDVSKNAQYYDAVAFVCSEGLFNGMTATKFEPTTTMTRAMFVTVLGRLADIDVSRYSGTSFTDVSKTDQQISWATPYIEWAVQNGITQGTGNGKFSPNDPITHQQMYLFMYRYAMFIENLNTNIANVSLSSIRDASEIADWAQDGVKFASKNNILITSGGKLTPADNALRCELAMLLEGFCTKVLGYND